MLKELLNRRRQAGEGGTVRQPVGGGAEVAGAGAVEPASAGSPGALGFRRRRQNRCWGQIEWHGLSGLGRYSVKVTVDTNCQHTPFQDTRIFGHP